MKILALETAADPGSVALWRDGTVTARTCPLDQTNSAALLPEARALLAEAGFPNGFDIEFTSYISLNVTKSAY